MGAPLQTRPAIRELALPEGLARQLRRARELVPDERRAAGPERLPTGVDGFDRLLRGGLARGVTVELVGRASSGRFALALALLAVATGGGEAAALIDLGDGLDPQAAGARGIDLERLLWLRPRTVKEALGGAEAALGCGIKTVVVDLGLPPLRGGRGAEAAWLRLARAARARRAALLISSPYRVSGTAPSIVLELAGRRAVWHGESRATPLLCGVAGELVRRKERGRGGGEARAGLRLPLPQAIAPTTAPPSRSADDPHDAGNEDGADAAGADAAGADAAGAHEPARAVA